MKTIHVLSGYNGKDEKRHCSDGDSSYVTGVFENTLVRLTGIDAPEVRGLSLYYLEKSGFLNRLKKQLREHLEPRLTQNSIQIHKKLGFEAWDFLESILEEEFFDICHLYTFVIFHKYLCNKNLLSIDFANISFLGGDAFGIFFLFY